MIIELAGRAFATIDDADFEAVSKHTWWLSTNGYAYTMIARKTIFLHRFLLDPGKGAWVDHVNRDRLDCRRANLRSSTISQSSANRCGRAISGFKGVMTIDRPGRNIRYRAEVWSDGVRHGAPYRGNAVDAAKDYDRLAREIHGEFAFQNFAGGMAS